MRKIFHKIAVILTTSSLVLPLTACVFNFYVNSATTTVMKSFADQTSSVLKSLILAKEKKTDTSQTIQDILSEFPNSSIKNQTKDISLNSWDEFKKYWGFNQQIHIDGFNSEEENYFVASGQGSLTTEVNNYRNTNNILTQANLIAGLNVVDNQIVYNLIKGGDIKTTIIDFLNQTKVTDPEQASTIIKLLKNTVVGMDWTNPNQQAFTNYIINPLTSLLNYLVEGLWTPTETTPTDTPSFSTFMTNWRDATDTTNFPNGQPYSQWNDGTNWTLKPNYYQDWNQTDYNFYRSGTLINYLFYKIGKDFQISEPEFKQDENGNWIIDPDKPPKPYKDRYLGDIISNYIVITPEPGIADQKLILDIMRYLPCLLENPAYIITLVEAVVPIIKEWALKMTDITQGAKKLTFGAKYPTIDNDHSYNALDILNNIQDLITNPEKLKPIISNLIGWTKEGNETIGTGIGKSFTYDIKISILGGIVKAPLGSIIDGNEGLIAIPKATKEMLVDAVVGFVNTDEVKSIFTNIKNIYQKWIKQYDDKGTGIIFDLTKLQDFLLNDTTGLITIINEQLINVLYEIMTDPELITGQNDAKYFEFYQGLGGVIPINPTDPAPRNFVENSVLDILQKNIGKTNEPLGQLALILLGNNSENNNGIFSFVIDSNNQWLKDNYTTFFDVTNKSKGEIYDAVMATSVENNIISTTLEYNFIYKLKDANNKTVTYSFWVRVKSSDKQNDFSGTKNFYFTDIILKSRK